MLDCLFVTGVGQGEQTEPQTQENVIQVCGKWKYTKCSTTGIWTELGRGNISNSLSGWERHTSDTVSWGMKGNRIEEDQMVNRHSEIAAAVELSGLEKSLSQSCFFPHGTHTTGVVRVFIRHQWVWSDFVYVQRCVAWHQLRPSCSPDYRKVNAERERRRPTCQTPTAWSHVPFCLGGLLHPPTPPWLPLHHH